MMDLITEQASLSQKPLQNNLSVLINLIEEQFPKEDLDDPEVLCRLLNKEFETEFVPSDIYRYYTVNIIAEDMRLQYKHLNITL